MTKTKITDPEQNIAIIQKQPAAELDELKSYLSKCLQLQGDQDPKTSITAELHAERAKQRIADFEKWPIEARAIALADSWVEQNAAELVSLLRSNLTERTKSKDGFLQSIGKRASAISLDMFTPSRDRDKLAANRQKLEDEASAVEAAIFEADQAIRMLGVSPSLATFRTADARVMGVMISLTESAVS
jgi:hypothetical protein